MRTDPRGPEKSIRERERERERAFVSVFHFHNRIVYKIVLLQSLKAPTMARFVLKWTLQWIIHYNIYDMPDTGVRGIGVHNYWYGTFKHLRNVWIAMSLYVVALTTDSSIIIHFFFFFIKIKNINYYLFFYNIILSITYNVNVNKHY